MFWLGRSARELASSFFAKPGIAGKNSLKTAVSGWRSMHTNLQESGIAKPEEQEASLYEPWQIRHLKSQPHIQQAQALLYEVYIKEMGWRFAENNPTGFRIETSTCGKKLLTDNLESHSSWFGVTFENTVVAVMRQVHRDSDGHLDLTRYKSSEKPSIMKLVCPSINPRVVELQRCAVKKTYRGSNVLPCLFHYLFINAALNEFSIIGTSPVGKMKSFLASTLKIPVVDQNFLYSENIEGPSTCFFSSGSNLYHTAEILEHVIKSSRYSNRRFKKILNCHNSHQNEASTT